MGPANETNSNIDASLPDPWPSSKSRCWLQSSSVATLMGDSDVRIARMYELFEFYTFLSGPADVSSFWNLRTADRHLDSARAWAAPSTPITIAQVPGPGSTESRKSSGPLFSPCANPIARPTKSHLVPPPRRTNDIGAGPGIGEKGDPSQNRGHGNYNIGGYAGPRSIASCPVSIAEGAYDNHQGV